jgi:hypothetical protein
LNGLTRGRLEPLKPQREAISIRPILHLARQVNGVAFQSFLRARTRQQQYQEGKSTDGRYCALGNSSNASDLDCDGDDAGLGMADDLCFYCGDNALVGRVRPIYSALVSAA